MMRKATKVKISMSILTLTLFILWYNVYCEFLSEITNKSHWSSLTFNINSLFQKRRTLRPAPHPKKKLPDIKYILMWTDPQHRPFKKLEIGQISFVRNHCPYINCYLTADRFFLEDYTQFDAVLFAGPDLIGDDIDLPTRRSDKQKYVFSSEESSENYPVCSERFNNYFNWTWTYRLDSENRLGYISIRNKKTKAVIGPKEEMHWIKHKKMLPVSNNFKKSLQSKTRAAAWFVTNCRTKIGREEFVRKLQRELDEYGLSVDTFGRCGDLLCPKLYQKDCQNMIKRHYYFYLAFENSFGPDYVTEKILHALKNNAIPVVFGGANYTRFMPEGIYLNANKLGPKNLAKKMNELINNPKKYADYFRWTNHYTYHMRSESVETNDYCNMCKLLNDKKMFKTKSVYTHFKDWWNLPNTCRSSNPLASDIYS